MSSFSCPVVTLSTIKPHTNADRLEIVEVLGWQVIVGKGDFVKGDKAVYVPIDTIVPDALATELNIKQHLKSGIRVRAARLRGEMSYGFLIKCPQDWLPGGNAAEFYGLTKYEPEEKVSFRGNTVGKKKIKKNWFKIVKYLLWPLKGCLGRIKNYLERKKFDGICNDTVPGFYKYTDIENIKNHKNVIDYGNELLVITEKIHGTNFRCGWIDGVWYVGSHNTVRQESDTDLYWQASKIYDLKNILKEGEILYGEIYGKKIQKMEYGMEGIDIAFFDLRKDGKFVNYPTFEEFCEVNNLPMVPYVCESKVLYDEIIALSKGNSFMKNTKHIKEGVVVKPVFERNDCRLGRVILKVINDDYLLGNFDEGGH